MLSIERVSIEPSPLRILSSECEILEHRLANSEKRIYSLIYGYEGAVAQGVAIGKVKDEVEAELDRVRQEYSREIAET